MAKLPVNLRIRSVSIASRTGEVIMVYGFLENLQTLRIPAAWVAGITGNKMPRIGEDISPFLPEVIEL